MYDLSVTIHRRYFPNCTLGNLTAFVNSAIVFKCKTVEPPYKDNQRCVSCVKEGTFPVIMVNETDKYKHKHFLLLDVPGRDNIRIMSAQYVNQMSGCVCPTKHIHDMNRIGKIDIFDSLSALTDLVVICEKYGYNASDKKDFKLTIREQPI